MKTLTRLTEKGVQTFEHYEDHLMVYLSGHYLSGALNQLPESMGGGNRMYFYRGNCSIAIPFQFRNIELAMDAFKKVRWERNGKKETAKVFSGNLWIGNIVDDEYIPREKPILQLL